MRVVFVSRKSQPLGSRRRPLLVPMCTDADAFAVAVLPHILNSNPDTGSTLIKCGNKAVHDAAAPFVYRELDVYIDFPGTLGHGTVGNQIQGIADKNRPCCPGYNSKLKLWAVFR